jgi:hypothetical protein
MHDGLHPQASTLPATYMHSTLVWLVSEQRDQRSRSTSSSNGCTACFNDRTNIKSIERNNPSSRSPKFLQKKPEKQQRRKQERRLEARLEKTRRTRLCGRNSLSMHFGEVSHNDSPISVTSRVHGLVVASYVHASSLSTSDQIHTTFNLTDDTTIALVRWPPMGRKKFMLDGQLRGRNELIQDSIRRDTGITRDRKQVSSHLQVLKQHLHNQPGGKSNTSLSACSNLSKCTMRG